MNNDYPSDAIVELMRFWHLSDGAPMRSWLATLDNAIWQEKWQLAIEALSQVRSNAKRVDARSLELPQVRDRLQALEEYLSRESQSQDA